MSPGKRGEPLIMVRRVCVERTPDEGKRGVPLLIVRNIRALCTQPVLVGSAEFVEYLRHISC